MPTDTLTLLDRIDAKFASWRDIWLLDHRLPTTDPSVRLLDLAESRARWCREALPLPDPNPPRSFAYLIWASRRDDALREIAEMARILGIEG